MYLTLMVCLYKGGLIGLNLLLGSCIGGGRNKAIQTNQELLELPSHPWIFNVWGTNLTTSADVYRSLYIKTVIFIYIGWIIPPCLPCQTSIYFTGLHCLQYKYTFFVCFICESFKNVLTSDVFYCAWINISVSVFFRQRLWEMSLRDSLPVNPWSCSVWRGKGLLILH